MFSYVLFILIDSIISFFVVRFRIFIHFVFSFYILHHIALSYSVTLVAFRIPYSMFLCLKIAEKANKFHSFVRSFRPCLPRLPKYPTIVGHYRASD